ncbi:MAG: hypothetical protein WAN51_12215, partial [Alphaproteobacteria bacterium]
DFLQLVGPDALALAILEQPFQSLVPETPDRASNVTYNVSGAKSRGETRLHLADGGQAQMPMTKTFFSRRFGIVADRFGVSWMIYVAPSG